jgi:hypothetical protein
MATLFLRLITPTLVLLLLSACGKEPEPPTTAPTDAAVSEAPPVSRVVEGQESLPAPTQPVPAMELDWEALIPQDWQPEEIMARFDLDALEDDDPRAKEMMVKIEALWEKAPVVQDLDGKRVKLPGFVVPLDTVGGKTGEFLLVPYYGACIHVPPPPANQTVFVQAVRGQEYSVELFDTVWVTGTLRVKSSSSDLAEAGYRLEATAIGPYE